jgi:hypothetical protein
LRHAVLGDQQSTANAVHDDVPVPF